MLSQLMVCLYAAAVESTSVPGRNCCNMFGIGAVQDLDTTHPKVLFLLGATTTQPTAKKHLMIGHAPCAQFRPVVSKVQPQAKTIQYRVPVLPTSLFSNGSNWCRHGYPEVPDSVFVILRTRIFLKNVENTVAYADNGLLIPDT